MHSPVHFGMAAAAALAAVFVACQEQPPPTPTSKSSANATERTDFFGSDEYEFRPNKGYEPYWADGAFMVEDPARLLPPNTTTPRIPTVCGEECTYIYRDLGKVCAHYSSNRTVLGCDPRDINYFRQFLNFAKYMFGTTIYPCYTNKFIDDFNGYNTFESYCDFLNTRCRQNRTYRWIFVHLGECRDQWDYYTEPRNQTLLLQRNHDYLSALKLKYPSLFKKT